MTISARYDAARKRLVITADNASRRDLADIYRDREHGGYPRAESAVGEELHEAYDFVAPEYIPGALTDAPILVASDDVIWPDNGETLITLTARVFWFPNYAIIDPWETLKNRGRVEFVEADSVDPDAPPPPVAPPDLADYLPGGERCGELFLIGGDFPPADALPEPLRTLYDARLDRRENVDPGLYFVKRGKLLGPYAPAAGGAMHAERDGALEAKPRPPEPAQPALFA